MTKTTKSKRWVNWNQFLWGNWKKGQRIWFYGRKYRHGITHKISSFILELYSYTSSHIKRHLKNVGILQIWVPFHQILNAPFLYLQSSRLWQLKSVHFLFHRLLFSLIKKVFLQKPFFSLLSFVSYFPFYFFTQFQFILLFIRLHVIEHLQLTRIRYFWNWEVRSVWNDHVFIELKMRGILWKIFELVTTSLRVEFAVI